MSELAHLIEAEDINDPTIVTMAGASQRTSALAAGRYYIYAQVDCRVKRGDSTVAASATTSHFIKAGTYWPFTVTQYEKNLGTPRDRLAFINTGAGGDIEISRVSR